MGYKDFEAPGYWMSLRHEEFPVTERLIYLNHAAVAPLPRRSANAMKNMAEDGCLHGSLHYKEWMETCEGARSAAARLVGATPGEIALIKNTSEGIATVALGLDWKPNDRIAAFREEFPANYYVWKKLEDWKGVRVEWLSYLDPLEKIEAAARGARLLAVSFVQYLSGFRMPLAEIGEICRRHGVFFFVDAIQGLGAFPLDVNALGIDAFAADGHKWLLGPEGCGVLYVRRERQDEVQPMEFGWTTVAGWTDYSSRDMALRTDAGRYECGTLNTIGCHGLRASIELILEIGVERIAGRVQQLGDLLDEGARRRGFEVLGERTPESGAGIVSVRKPGEDARLTWTRLKEFGVASAPRQGWLRLSPHCYILPEDIERVLDFMAG